MVVRKKRAKKSKKSYGKLPPMKIDGLPVVNLKKKIRLVISERDCKSASKKAPEACAAAMAAMRQIPNCTEARVHVNRVYLKIGKVWHRGTAPNSLRSEIVAFDRGGTFAPGVYAINTLPPSQATGRAHSLDAPKRGNPNNKRPQHYTLDVRTNAHREYSGNKRFT